MPKIINADQMQVKQGDGWTVRTVADASHLGAPAMTARWWTFEPNATGPVTIRGSADELLYVIRGSGQAMVNQQTFDLDNECVLWVDEGESYQFVAGDEGLEILQGYAPGEPTNE